MLLQIKNLKKYFDLGDGRIVHAVDDISLTIAENEVLGLVGESGSGKSTFGKTIVGLLDKTAGEVIYQGESLPHNYRAADFKRCRGKMQMIFQDPFTALNPRLTVGEIIAEPLRLSDNLSAREEKQRVVFWLEKVGLSQDHLGRYPHEFSGGQRQRVGIARALIMEPELVICDEPISALDVSVQAQIINLLIELKKSMSLTMVFIAHDLTMVRFISDRVAVMYLGSLVEEGPAAQVFDKPLHPYTKALIASKPEPDPRIEQKRQHHLIKGDIPSPINPPAGCRFAGRCSQVIQRCHHENPDRIKAAPGHYVNCHLY